jgi:hypothetical protein
MLPAHFDYTKYPPHHMVEVCATAPVSAFVYVSLKHTHLPVKD